MQGGQLWVGVVVMATGEQPFTQLWIGEDADGVTVAGGGEGGEEGELRPGARVRKPEAGAAGEDFGLIGFEVGGNGAAEEELWEVVGHAASLRFQCTKMETRELTSLYR